MIHACLELELRLYAASSLKEKRFVVKSVKDRLRRRFNVAVAEIGSQDVWRSAEFGVVTVGSSRMVVDRELEAVTRFLDADGRFELVRRDIDFY